MTDITYDQLKAQALLGCESAADIMDSIHEVNDPQSVQTVLEIAKVTLMGAQIYATLAVAQAEQNAALQERGSQRTSPRPPAFSKGPLRSVKKDEEN